MPITAQIEQALFSFGIIPMTINEVIADKCYVVSCASESFVVEVERGAILIPSRIANRQNDPIQNLCRKIANSGRTVN